MGAARPAGRPARCNVFPYRRADSCGGTGSPEADGEKRRGDWTLQRIFSGIQPTGALHVGNYLGAIRNWVDLLDKYDSVYCIVNYHAITIPYDPKELPERVLDTAATLIASGIDPERCIFFAQADVPEHTELCWLLNVITPLGHLQRMHQFKEKAQQHAQHVNAGLMNYPILQAADILLYKAHLVPVGEDQLQHIELTREVARRFNNTFGEVFPDPQAYMTSAARVMALNDPERKMSKSIPGSYIALSDSPEEIRRKVSRAVTDTGPSPDGAMSPGVKNLFTLLEGFAEPDVVSHFREQYDQGTLRYSELKPALADAIIEKLTPIRERREELLADADGLRDILRAGGEKARAIARETIDEVRERMGLVG